MSAQSDELKLALEANGLHILGYFSPTHDEIVLADRDVQPKVIAIIGNAGSSIWPYFAAAREVRSGLSLDQWTEETVGDIAGEFGANPLYPFQGPPFWPFIQWAKRTATLFSSPLGLTVHPTFGLWQAFRAALLFDEDPGFPPIQAESPCTTCTARPCLTTCPVNAFSEEEGYDFNACLSHLGTNRNVCRSEGCLARAACPIGQDHRYLPEHAAFHMNQLLKAHGRGPRPA